MQNKFKDKRCNSCGSSLSDFYKTGMLGCPDCYYAFGAEVSKVVAKVQGKSAHVGKKTKVSATERELLIEYERLLDKKEEAAIDGDFESTASLSEEIYELSEELKKRGLL